MFCLILANRTHHSLSLNAAVAFAHAPLPILATLEIPKNSAETILTTPDVIEAFDAADLIAERILQQLQANDRLLMDVGLDPDIEGCGIDYSVIGTEMGIVIAKGNREFATLTVVDSQRFTLEGIATPQ